MWLKLGSGRAISSLPETSATSVKPFTPPARGTPGREQLKSWRQVNRCGALMATSSGRCAAWLHAQSAHRPRTRRPFMHRCHRATLLAASVVRPCGPSRRSGSSERLYRSGRGLGNDEIAHLTRAFNHMARTQAQMEEQPKNRESANRARTAHPAGHHPAWLEAARDGLATTTARWPARCSKSDAPAAHRRDLQLLP